MDCNVLMGLHIAEFKTHQANRYGAMPLDLLIALMAIDVCEYIESKCSVPRKIAYSVVHQNLFYVFPMIEDKLQLSVRHAIV